jgi:hypothetical protein
LLAQGGWRVHDEGLERDHGARPALHGSVAHDLDLADHLDSAGAALRARCGLTGDHGTGGALRIERVALAVLVAQLPVRTVHLDDGVSFWATRARERPAP